MSILGHGVDIIEIDRVQGLLHKHPDRFTRRCFTRREVEYCDRGGTFKAQCYAVRFAAKEAIAKALGTGIRDGMRWTDLEITRDASGKPGVRLHGSAAVEADRCGIRSWHIALSHSDGMALASVIAEGG